MNAAMKCSAVLTRPGSTSRVRPSDTVTCSRPPGTTMSGIHGPGPDASFAACNRRIHFSLPSACRMRPRSSFSTTCLRSTTRPSASIFSMRPSSAGATNDVPRSPPCFGTTSIWVHGANQVLRALSACDAVLLCSRHNMRARRRPPIACGRACSSLSGGEAQYRHVAGCRRRSVTRSRSSPMPSVVRGLAAAAPAFPTQTSARMRASTTLRSSARTHNC